MIYLNERWWPAAARAKTAIHIRAGDVIAHDYCAWIVRKIEAHEREYSMEVDRLHGTHEVDRGVMTTGSLYSAIQVYESTRIPLCSCCDNPYPCRIQEAERIAAAHGQLMEERMQRAGIPGTCYACGEPITTRQDSITYPAAEGNIQLPGYPSPRFHTRNKCREGRWAYARAREKALPDEVPFDTATIR